MTDVLEDRLRAAADTEMSGVELEHPTSTADPTAATRGRGRGTLAAVAAAVAVLVLGAVTWGVMGGSPSDGGTAEPSPQRATPVEELRSAIDATLSAPAWQAELDGPDGETFWVFDAPDRVEERVADASGQDWVTRSVTIGDTTWSRTVPDGAWQQSTSLGWDSASPVVYLRLIGESPCASRLGSDVLSWRAAGGGCGSSATELPGDLPIDSEIYLVTLDDAGRVSSVRYGSIPGVDGQPMLSSDLASDDPFAQVGAAGGPGIRIHYDDVPPVTEPSGG
jgi:hypothetical protein